MYAWTSVSPVSVPKVHGIAVFFIVLATKSVNVECFNELMKKKPAQSGCFVENIRCSCRGNIIRWNVKR